MHNWIAWLDQGGVPRETVGGKGASLSLLSALGAPVPLAFCVTTRAYRDFAVGLGLPFLASSVRDDEIPGIRAAIDDAEMPRDIGAAICEAFGVLQVKVGKRCPVAVRSSATAEDSAAFSFAGLHDTVLDVLAPEDLERAVKQCWASLWTERAVIYRRSGGDATDDASMAVVVQRLVQSDVSFVAFTADPIHWRNDHLIISATYGLGEAVVSGLVTPDHIVIDGDGAVESYQVGEKEIMIIPGDHPGEGVRTVAVPRMLGRLPAMTSDQAQEIGQNARKLAQGLGFPADFEGAISEGRIYFFQARPITTLAGAEIHGRDP